MLDGTGLAHMHVVETKPGVTHAELYKCHLLSIKVM